MKLTEAIMQLRYEMQRAGIDPSFMIVLPTFDDGMKLRDQICMETAPINAHHVSDPTQTADRQSLKVFGVTLTWPAHGFQLPEFHQVTRSRDGR